MAYKGFNFRATGPSGTFVTDGANDSAVYQLAGPALQNYSYPSFSNGLSAGWVSGGDVNNFRNRNAALDPRLAGIWFNNVVTKAEFRIDCTGSVNIRLALGDDASGWSHTCAIYDGAAGSPFATITGTTGTSQWLDATGTLRTSASDWVSNNASISRTVTGGYLRFVIGDGTGSGVNSTISHIAVDVATASDLSGSATLETLTVSGTLASPSDLSGSATLNSLTVSGSFDSPATLAGNAALDSLVTSGTLQGGATATGNATLDTLLAAGVLGRLGQIVSEALKTNNGTVLANAPLNYVSIYDQSTGALVLRVTGLSTDATGVFTVTDPVLVPGTTYRIDWETATGQRRMPLKAAA